MKTTSEIRKLYLDFWQENPRNSKVIPNASLVPNNDPTLLFVNSGMFPIVPYLAGEPHPLGKRVHNVQRCVRTNDIEEVGDNRHFVMFEMIGNWSLGDFTKVDQIPWIFEFLIERLELDPKRMYVSVFAGDESAPRDDEAINIWKETFAKYDVEAEFSDDITNLPKNIEEGKSWKYRIFPYPKKKNWWTRAEIPGELGGPTSEMFYDMGIIEREEEQYHINDDSGRFIEVGNNVFMEYKMDANHTWQPLAQKNIDFGGGFERLVMASQGTTDPFLVDIFLGVIKKIEELSVQKYVSKVELNDETKAFRVIAEHARSATFIIADGIVPGSKDQGYILRRLIRRMVRFGHKVGIDQNFTKDLAEIVIDTMKDDYPHLEENRARVLEEIEKEEVKFRKTLKEGLKQFDRLWQTNDINLNGTEAFRLYETYGFPIEMILEEIKERAKEKQAKFDNGAEETFVTEFNAEQDKHRAQSKAGAEQKFKGGLADASVETTKLHTAHHLLLAALQKVVDPSIKQRGSNITAERLRIDFNYGDKLTPEQIKEVEDIVNQNIEAGLNVVRVEMPKADAEKMGAQMEFGQKYPDIVSVYIIGKNIPKEGSVTLSEVEGRISAEFCGGPHVKNTSELAEGGKKFKILKEESSGAGIRRIKAALI